MASLTNDKDIDIPEGLITPHMENKPYYKMYNKTKDVNELRDIITILQRSDAHHDFKSDRGSEKSSRNSNTINKSINRILNIFKNINTQHYSEDKLHKILFPEEEALSDYETVLVDQDDIIKYLKKKCGDKQIYFFIDTQRNFFDSWMRTKVNFEKNPIIVNTRSTFSDPAGTSNMKSSGKKNKEDGSITYGAGDAYKSNKITYGIENTKTPFIHYNKFNKFKNDFSEILLSRSDILSTLLLDKNKGKYIWEQTVSNLIFLDHKEKLIITDGEYAKVSEGYGYSIKNKTSIFDHFERNIKNIFKKKVTHSKGSFETLLISKRLGDWLQAFIMTMNKDINIDTYTYNGRNKIVLDNKNKIIKFNDDTDVKLLLTYDKLLRSFALFIGVPGLIFYKTVDKQKKALIYIRKDRFNKQNLKKMIVDERNTLFKKYYRITESEKKVINTINNIEKEIKSFEKIKKKIMSELEENEKTIEEQYKNLNIDSKTIPIYEFCYKTILRTFKNFLKYIPESLKYKTFINIKNQSLKNIFKTESELNNMDNKSLRKYINEFQIFLLDKRNVIKMYDTYTKKNIKKQTNIVNDKILKKVSLFNDIYTSSVRFINLIYTDTNINNSIGTKILTVCFNHFNNFISIGFLPDDFININKRILNNLFQDITRNFSSNKGKKILKKYYNVQENLNKNIRNKRKYDILNQYPLEYFEIKKNKILEIIEKKRRKMKGGDRGQNIIINKNFVDSRLPNKDFSLNKSYINEIVKQNLKSKTHYIQDSITYKIMNNCELYIELNNYTDIFMDRIILYLQKCNINYNDIQPDDYISSILFYLNNPNKIEFRDSYSNIEKILDPMIYALNIDQRYMNNINKNDNTLQKGGVKYTDIEIDIDSLKNIDIVEIFEEIIIVIENDNDIKEKEKKEIIKNYLNIYVFYLYLQIIQREKHDIYIRRNTATKHSFKGNPEIYSPPLYHCYEIKDGILLECAPLGGTLRINVEDRNRIIEKIQIYIDDILLLTEYFTNYEIKIPYHNYYHRRIINIDEQIKYNNIKINEDYEKTNSYNSDSDSLDEYNSDFDNTESLEELAEAENNTNDDGGIFNTVLKLTGFKGGNKNTRKIKKKTTRKKSRKK